MSTKRILLAIVCGAVMSLSVMGHERVFTYSYEPGTLPKGELEFEQWTTLRAGRNDQVGQADYVRLQFREELEYGITDIYQASLYFNHQYEHFNDPGTGNHTSHYRQTGFSLENKLMVLNPAEHCVGLALYLEPTYDGENFELEQKIILGKRYDNWRWAFNLTHATEWEDHFDEYEGEFEASMGVSWQLSSRWWVGLEARDHNEIPEYREWENTAIYLGPVVTYKRRNWWASLTIMPQIYGDSFHGDPDHNRQLDLDGHERINVRLLFGFDF